MTEAWCRVCTRFKSRKSERGKESKTKSEIGIRKIALLKVSAYSIGC